MIGLIEIINANPRVLEIWDQEKLMHTMEKGDIIQVPCIVDYWRLRTRGGLAKVVIRVHKNGGLHEQEKDRLLEVTTNFVTVPSISPPEPDSDVY